MTETIYIACPPPCTNGERCRNEYICTPLHDMRGEWQRLPEPLPDVAMPEGEG